VSAAQLQELCAAVAGPVWRGEGARVEFDREPAAGSGYGIAAYQSRRLYGILRPSPASLHRVPPAVPVFLRNAREAQQIIEAGVIAPERVVHFDLPDHEQTPLF
jgi:competence protein CoiA